MSDIGFEGENNVDNSRHVSDGALQQQATLPMMILWSIRRENEQGMLTGRWSV